MRTLNTLKLLGIVLFELAVAQIVETGDTLL